MTEATTAMWQSLSFPADMVDLDFAAAIDTFREAALDAYLRREMRYIIADSDDEEARRAAFKVLSQYTLREPDPNLPNL